MYRSPAAGSYDRFRRAVEGESFPLALIELAALDHNIDRLLAPIREKKKSFRLATKSVRCLSLIRRIVARAGPTARGLMSYSTTEAAFLVKEGFDDIFVAYPIGSRQEAELLASLNERRTVAICADSIEHFELLDSVSRKRGIRLPVVLEVDLSYRPLGGAVHLGVRRSPLLGADALIELAEKWNDSAESGSTASWATRRRSRECPIAAHR